MIIKSKAKVNLTIDVLYKRPDNYHQLEMVMQEIQLADEMKFYKNNSIKIVCDHSFVPEDDSNLVYKAVELVRQELMLKGESK